MTWENNIVYYFNVGNNTVILYVTAVWMLPENWVYGGWPLSGEIDIVESRGNRNLRSPSGQQIGSELAGSTLHFGKHYYKYRFGS